MIKAGTLCIVVRTHCDASAHLLGQIRTVLEVKRSSCLLCSCCDALFKYGDPIAELIPGGWIPTAWLRPLPPLEGSQETMEEVEA
jgi:hypothetical protein